MECMVMQNSLPMLDLSWNVMQGFVITRHVHVMYIRLVHLSVYRER